MLVEFYNNQECIYKRNVINKSVIQYFSTLIPDMYIEINGREYLIKKHKRIFNNITPIYKIIFYVF